MAVSAMPKHPGMAETAMLRKSRMPSDSIDSTLRVTLDKLLVDRRPPGSTYRLQFFKGFGFKDATAIVPYLHALGVTHCYASPYLKATTGSTHGYDVIDHTQLNPELGTRADYDAWIDAMAAVGMKHILDTVPNHMGVGTNDNAQWNDLLEDGSHGQFGKFFDVAWSASRRPELHGKVLLATLGKPFGESLDAGELVLKRDGGDFFVDSFDTHYPIATSTYPRILTADAEGLGEAFAGDDAALAELGAISNAAATLPEEVEARDAAKRQIRGRLATLLASNVTAAAYVDDRVTALNGKPGDPRSKDALDALLTAQNYRLADWQIASHEVNYRRFFDVGTLAAIAMERMEVFEHAHELIYDLLAAGKIDGLRIDHSDGLYDPHEYFLRLQRGYLLACAKLEGKDAWAAAARVLPDAPGTSWPLYVLTEKILAPREPLPHQWPMNGTSGYDILNEINGLFVEPNGEASLDETYEAFVPDSRDYQALAYDSKRLVLERSFASELNLLTHQLDHIANRHREARDFTFVALHDCLRELIACFAVYRSYITPTQVTPRDAEVIDAAIAKAESKNAGIDERLFAFVRKVLLDHDRYDEMDRSLNARFAGKFQQLTSPVTAKGLEDTAFYIYYRLTSLNEVGGEPDRFGVSPESLHQTFVDRQREWPDAMSVLSTHDTKRSEDVRARISVLSEIPDDWRTAVESWRAILKPDGVHPNDEYLLYQSLVGAWPSSKAGHGEFPKRVAAYLQKAMREAKERTSWIAVDEAYEKHVYALIDRAFSSREFANVFAPFQSRVARAGAVNSLAQTAIRLLAPGVPDTYQGSEFFDLSLVDPDNRRPVDYEARRTLLARVDAGPRGRIVADAAADPSGDSAKLLVTTASLRLRRERPELFSRGAYLPLAAAGSHAGRVFAFARTSGDDVAIVVVPRCVATLAKPGALPVGNAWGDTAIDLSSFGPVSDRVHGKPHAGTALLSNLFASLPVAILTNG